MPSDGVDAPLLGGEDLQPLLYEPPSCFANAVRSVVGLALLAAPAVGLGCLLSRVLPIMLGVSPLYSGPLLALLPIGVLYGLAWRKFHGKVAHLATGEQRRQVCPPGQTDWAPVSLAPPVPVDPSQYSAMSDFFVRENGDKLFYTRVEPSDGQVDKVIVLLHGYSNHHQSGNANVARALATKYRAAVFGFDQPGHGCSDGLFCHIPDWFGFVKASQEFIDAVARPRCQQPGDSPPLKLFGMGESMGGGVLATLCLQHPRFLDGVVFVAPMLYVSDHMKPPWVVIQLFKYVLVKLFPLAPVAPSKDVLDHCYSDPDQLVKSRANPFAYNGKPRLGTAFQLAFRCSDWLGPRLQDFDTPFLLIHGADDVVTSPSISQKLFDVAKTPDKTFKLYPECKHADALSGGPRLKEKVLNTYSDIGGWLADHCSEHD